jgi:predicted phosphodiesterase
MSRTRIALRSCQASLVLGAFALALVLGPKSAPAETLAAWVQLVGPARDASIRVITDDARCPTLKADGADFEMQVRAARDTALYNPAPDVRLAPFPVLTCEATAPAGKASILLDGRPLPLPAANIRRIVIFGDTGCRIKENKKPQDCVTKWPYQKIARHAAAAHPDLVIHVGDYLYRESCNAAACANTPTGYGWEEWRDDFFAPSAPLFAAGPWIMVRGNHEICSRAGEGWFRFLHNGRPPDACALMNGFFVVGLGNMGFVVMDSGQIAKEKDMEKPGDNAADDDDDDDEDVANSADAAKTIAALRRDYDEISARLPSPAWLLTHVPFNAVKRDKSTGDDRIVDTVQQQALGDQLPREVEMIVSGHVHMFEAFSFADANPPRPPQLVVGTGGVKLTKKPKKPDEIGGAPVSDAFILKEFAYIVWDREGTSWRGAMFDEDGAQIARCRLEGRGLRCGE